MRRDLCRLWRITSLAALRHVPTHDPGRRPSRRRAGDGGGAGRGRHLRSFRWAAPEAFGRAVAVAGAAGLHSRLDGSPLPYNPIKRLEAESIHIMREAVSDCERPVMLYSIGKDSSVMLHLAMKAFYPSKPPFPLLHVDTTWKFREMYRLPRPDCASSGSI